MDRGRNDRLHKARRKYVQAEEVYEKYLRGLVEEVSLDDIVREASRKKKTFAIEPATGRPFLVG